MTVPKPNMNLKPQCRCVTSFCRVAFRQGPYIVYIRHRRLSVAAMRAAAVRDAPLSSPPTLTFEEVCEIGRSRSLFLSLKTLGPFYSIVCRDTDEKGKIWGLTTGFTIPFLRLMHCDALQIFTRGVGGIEGDRLRGGVLGLGLLLGAATFAFGYQLGCTKAEILAINDDDKWHARLVRYYCRFGFVPVVEVTGGKLSDLPHMLVWGGAGTRMDADIPAMLMRWQGAIRRTD